MHIVYLEKRIGLMIPEDITDQELISSGLLDLSIPASGQSDFNSYLLEIFFGSFMNKAGAIYRVEEISSAYEPDQWQAALDRPLVKKAYLEWFRNQRQAMESAHQPAELQLLAWLEKSPEVYISNLSALKLLANYPDHLGENVLGSHYPELLALGLDLRKLSVDHGILKVVDELRIYLNSYSFQSIERIIGDTY